MSKNNTPSFTWDEEKGVATCTLQDGNNYFVGIAQCCETDRDMQSEKTGCDIALRRAEIKYYIHLRDNEIKPGLKALQQLYSNMVISKNYNKKSYEARMLYRRIKQFKNDLDIINEMLTDAKQELKTVIEQKDKFYRRIRANRANAISQDGQN